MGHVSGLFMGMGQKQRIGQALLGLGLIDRNATLTGVKYSHRIFGLHGNPNPLLVFPFFSGWNLSFIDFHILSFQHPSHSFLLLFINYSLAIPYLPSVIYKLFLRLPLVRVRWKFWNVFIYFDIYCILRLAFSKSLKKVIQGIGYISYLFPSYFTYISYCIFCVT